MWAKASLKEKKSWVEGTCLHRGNGLIFSWANFGLETQGQAWMYQPPRPIDLQKRNSCCGILVFSTDGVPFLGEIQGEIQATGNSNYQQAKTSKTLYPPDIMFSWRSTFRHASRKPCWQIFGWLKAAHKSSSRENHRKREGVVHLKRHAQRGRLFHVIPIKTRCFLGNFPCFLQVPLLLAPWQVFEFRMGHNLILPSIDFL